MTGEHLPNELVTALVHTLVELAREQDDLASVEAARVPYWSPCPASVQGHRSAAAVLREQAALLVA